MAECAAYLTQGSSSALDCEPDFLGPEPGWATVRSLGIGKADGGTRPLSLASSLWRICNAALLAALGDGQRVQCDGVCH